MSKTTIQQYLGIDSSSVAHREKIISALGGFVGILCVFYISGVFVGVEGAIYIIPSMGATAVLIFAAPHSPLGQPWNVFGGHLFSAAAGVICALLIPTVGLAAAASVGLAIVVMHYARCMHPPGGATALAAVIGGAQIHAMGFQYIVTPVLINTVTILLIPFLFNGLFKWNRYPNFLISKTPEETETEAMLDVNDNAPVQYADLVYALSQIDTEVTEEDLLQIYRCAAGKDVSLPVESELYGDIKGSLIHLKCML